MKAPNSPANPKTGFRLPNFAVTVSLLVLGAICSPHRAMAANGTWTNLAGGSWNTSGNWLGNTIATGNGDTANFNTLDITGVLAINNNVGGGGLTIGTLNFADTAGANGTFLISGNSIDMRNNSNPSIINVVGVDDLATISVALTDSASKGITKTGLGTLVLTNSANITGGTIVSGGVLELSGAGVITNTVQVTVNSGGTLLLGSATTTNQVTLAAPFSLLGGTLELGTNGMSQTFGALTLSGNSVIDFGSLTGTNNLIFGASNAISWAGATLKIYNWTLGTDHLFFGNTLGSGLTTGQLAQIEFYSDGGSTLLGTGQFGPGAGEVSPFAAVPEPSTIFAGLSLLSLVAYRERRWLFRCREARSAV